MSAMDGSLDGKEDSLLDDLAQAANEYHLNQKQVRMVDFIKKNIPISGIAEVLTEDLWLREILKDVDSSNPSVRSKSLHMLGTYLGLLAAKGNKVGRKEVSFESGD